MNEVFVQKRMHLGDFCGFVLIYCIANLVRVFLKVVHLNAYLNFGGRQITVEPLLNYLDTSYSW